MHRVRHACKLILKLLLGMPLGSSTMPCNLIGRIARRFRGKLGQGVVLIRNERQNGRAFFETKPRCRIHTSHQKSSIA